MLNKKLILSSQLVTAYSLYSAFAKKSTNPNQKIREREKKYYFANTQRVNRF